MGYQDIHNFLQGPKFQHKLHDLQFNRTEIKISLYRNIEYTTNKEMATVEEVMNTLYVVLTGIFSVLSMIGTSVIIFTYVYYPELRSKGRHFLVFISAADFLMAFGVLLGVIWTSDTDAFTEAFCKASPIITAFSSVCSYFWNVCMAVYLYLTLVKRCHHLVKKFTIFSHVICWSIPRK